MKRFLFWIASEQANFIHSELKATFKLFNLDIKIYDNRKINGPFLILNFPSSIEAKKIISRSVLIHACYEILTEGLNVADVKAKLLETPSCFSQHTFDSFRIRIDSYNKRLKQSEKLAIIDQFDFLPLQGEVNLADPQLALHYILYYGLDPNCIPSEPYNVYFCKWIADGQRHLVNKISLKDRKFIGNTTMDPLLSLIMANIGLVKEGSLVYDPFVGTGSLLVGAGVFGGHVLGGDIDYLTVHAKSRPSRVDQKVRSSDESVRANFEQYDLSDHYIDVFVADAALPFLHPKLKFDAIITDPPYGVREQKSKIGSLDGKAVPVEHLSNHLPCKVSYSLTDLYRDLMKMATERLVVGGRLVTWIPVQRKDYNESALPSSPSLNLIENVEQVLTSQAARRLLVYEKVFEPSDSNGVFVDDSSPMYKSFALFDKVAISSKKERAERKLNAVKEFGSRGKRGQLNETNKINVN